METKSVNSIKSGAELKSSEPPNINEEFKCSRYLMIFGVIAGIIVLTAIFFLVVYTKPRMTDDANKPLEDESTSKDTESKDDKKDSGKDKEGKDGESKDDSKDKDKKEEEKDKDKTDDKKNKENKEDKEKDKKEEKNDEGSKEDKQDKKEEEKSKQTKDSADKELRNLLLKPNARRKFELSNGHLQSGANKSRLKHPSSASMPVAIDIRGDTKFMVDSRPPSYHILAKQRNRW